MNDVNTRADLEKMRGTPEFARKIRALAGSMTMRQDVADYPDGYGEDDYDGPTIEPEWENVEDMTIVSRFGFTKQEVLDELAAVG